MQTQKSNMETAIQKHDLKKDTPIHRPLIHELTTELKSTTEVGLWISEQEDRPKSNWKLNWKIRTLLFQDLLRQWHIQPSGWLFDKHHDV